MANIEALNELKRVLRAVPDERFNISRWVMNTDCGTVCCALGWAAQDQYFIKNGLGLRVSHITDDLEPFLPDGNEGFPAGAKAFGITLNESDCLFWGTRYKLDGWTKWKSAVTRHDVITRIDHLIDHYTLQRDEHVRAYRRLTEQADRLLEDVLANRALEPA